MQFKYLVARYNVLAVNGKRGKRTRHGACRYDDIASLNNLSRAVGSGHSDAARPVNVRCSFEDLRLVFLHQKLDAFSAFQDDLVLVLLGLNEIQRDARVARYMNYEPRSLDQTQASVDSAMQHRNDSPRAVYDLAISEHGSDLLIGRCGFGIRRPEHREAMIWYELHPDKWGRGYATEAALQAIDFAFNQLGQERVISLIQPENGGSVAVALRLGMRFDGYTEVLSRPVLVYSLDRRPSSNG